MLELLEAVLVISKSKIDVEIRIQLCGIPSFLTLHNDFFNLANA